MIRLAIFNRRFIGHSGPENQNDLTFKPSTLHSFHVGITCRNSHTNFEVKSVIHYKVPAKSLEDVSEIVTGDCHVT